MIKNKNLEKYKFKLHNILHLVKMLIIFFLEIKINLIIA